MINLGPATEHEMVVAFLRADVDSVRLGGDYQQCFDQIKSFGFDGQHLIDSPDLKSVEENTVRKEILKGFRGYGKGELLFRGFPADVVWRRVALEQPDLLKLKYANFRPWVELSRGTRVVSEGAKNIGPDTPAKVAAENIRAIAGDLKRGKRYPALIGVDGQNGNITLLDGHTRATAYALIQLPEPIDCIVGSSSTMDQWLFY